MYNSRPSYEAVNSWPLWFRMRVAGHGFTGADSLTPEEEEAQDLAVAKRAASFALSNDALFHLAMLCMKDRHFNPHRTPEEKAYVADVLDEIESVLPQEALDRAAQFAAVSQQHVLGASVQ